MNQENLQRVLEDQELAESEGFKLQPTIYALGTDVLPIGVENYKKSRKEYEALPDVDEAVEGIIGVIQSEDRQDAEFDLQTSEMSTGLYTLIMVDNDSVNWNLIPTPWSLKQLIERTRPYEKKNEAVSKAATYVSDPECPVYFKREVTNYYLATAKDKNNNSLKATFRTRAIKQLYDYRELFAVVSDRYNTDCDTDKLAEMVRRKVEESEIPARAEVLYDTRRFRMSVLYHSDVETPVVGELFKAGVIIDSADDGSKSISITPMVMRNLCLNFIILDRATQTVSLTHLRSDLYDGVSEAIDKAMAKVAEFGEKWAIASKERIIDSVYEDADPTRVFTQLVKQGLVKIPGTSRNDLIDKLVDAWWKEPGYQKTNIINALTRAAHESSWSSPWVSTDLEEQAGKLLYNKVFVNYSQE